MFLAIGEKALMQFVLRIATQRLPKIGGINEVVDPLFELIIRFEGVAVAGFET